MAWRIHDQLIRGEIDNRERGRVTGRLWFVGLPAPVVLDLRGDAWRDVAGHLVRFVNPAPQPGEPDLLCGLGSEQHGVVGDITVSRKMRVPECSAAEMRLLAAAGHRYPWHWGNGLYLEWHDERNGRVVIESANYRIDVDPDAWWRMSAAEERAQREANARANQEALRRMAEAENTSATEGDATVSGPGGAASARSGRERRPLRPTQGSVLATDPGQTSDEAPGPPPWLDHLDAAAEAALRDARADPSRGGEPAFVDDRWHPLVARCHVFTHRLRDRIAAESLLDGAEVAGHPLHRLVEGVRGGGGKLAGVLGTVSDSAEWPPGPLMAGAALKRLFQARRHFRDAVAGVDAAAEWHLGDAAWRLDVREELGEILDEVQRLIAEVRAVLRLSNESDSGSAV